MSNIVLFRGQHFRQKYCNDNIKKNHKYAFLTVFIIHFTNNYIVILQYIFDVHNSFKTKKPKKKNYFQLKLLQILRKSRLKMSA